MRMLTELQLQANETCDTDDQIPQSRTCMWAEQLVLDHCCQWQEIEEVCEDLPNARAAILAQALLVEPVHLRDLPALMVAPDDIDPAGVPDLER